MKRLTLILLFFVVMSGCYYLLTKRKSAEAIINLNTWGKTTDSPPGTRAIFQTQTSVICGDEVIIRAIDDYQLNILFETDQATLLKDISENIESTRERKTGLISIKAFSHKEEQAQQICYAIVHSYDELRRESIENTRNEVIAKYKQKIKSQEDKVEDCRAKLYKLSKKLGIGYYSSDSQHLLLHYEGEKTKSSTPEQILESAKRERDLLEIFVADLKELKDNRLIVRILASNRSEAVMLKAYDTKLAELKALKNTLVARGLAEDHPKIVSINTSIHEASEQLAETARLTREKLTSDLATINKRLKKLEEDILYQARKSQSKTEEHTEFGNVKDEYEREFKILQSIKSSEFRETIVSRLEIDPLQISQPGWTPEVEKMMKERKIGNK